MNGFWNHFLVTLRLNFRNIQAVVFGYIFPLCFLVVFGAFYTSYPPLVDELGQVLTITIMGGACFGMPVSIVSERDRGVWRRYRLTPMPTIAFVASTLAARYVIVLTAAILQYAVAMIFYKVPLPSHPFDLWATFTFVSFAFLGLGLVIAMVANSTGAVQGLGQIFFLPMIMVGGVGVKLRNLPLWAKHFSAFLPGRYSVDAMSSCIVANGAGLSVHPYNLAALTLTGVATCLAASKMFRWEPEQKLTARTKLWLLFCVLIWVSVGIGAELLNIAVPGKSGR